MPNWPPKVFSARSHTFTRPWQKHKVLQKYLNRHEGDPRLAEGDALSNIMMWPDCHQVTDRLVGAAIESVAWDIVSHLQ